MPTEVLAEQEPLLLGEESGIAPSGTALALGLTWKVLLGEKLDVLALQKALMAKATHYVHSQNVSNVGYAQLPIDKKIKYLSAAGIVAHQRQLGDFLIGLQVNEDQNWLCGISNGTVVSGYDLVINNQSDLQQLVNDFKNRFGTAKLQGDISDEFKDEYSWENLKTAAGLSTIKADATLRSTKIGMADRFKGVPRSYLVVGGLLAFLVLGQRFVWPIVNTAFFKPKAAPVVDPEDAWQESITEWIMSHPVSGSGSLNTLLNSLADQPLIVAGWRQTSVSCVWGSKAWQCSAKYRASSRKETNEAFTNSIPTGWRVEFSLLKDATAKFDIPTTTKKLTVATLKPVKDYEIGVASKIQEITPLISNSASPIGPFVQVPVKEPKNEKGTTIALPSGIALPKVSPVTLSGPARTIAAMQSWVDDVAWTNVVLAIDPSKTPTANDSTVMMELKGNIYAKK